MVIESLIVTALIESGKWVGKNVITSWQNKKMKFKKDDIAIVVEISQPILPRVEKFLKLEKIDADIVTIKDKDKRQKLQPQRELWEGIVSEFVRIINEIYSNAAPEKLHIFLSAPSALTFAMGCILRTLHSPKVYQFNFDTQSYDLVVVVSDSLRPNS